MTKERRRHPRRNSAQFTFIQLEQEFGGRVLNYSKEGLCFQTSASIPDTDLVQFWLSYHGQGQIDGVGRVTWLNEKKNLGGMAFIHLSRTARQKVEEWVSAPPEGGPVQVEKVPEAEESPEDIVAQIMRQVLTEKHGSAVRTPFPTAVAVATQAQEAETRETAGSVGSPVVTPPTLVGLGSGSINTAAACAPPEAEQTDTRSSAEASTITPPVEKIEDSANAAVAAKPQELGSTKTQNSVVSAVFTPAASETLELPTITRTSAENTVEVGSAGVLSPPALRTLDVPPSPAAFEPQQINHPAAPLHGGLLEAPTRKWHSSLPSSSEASTEQTDGPRDWNSLSEDSSEETREMVLLKEQPLRTRRARVLRGAIGTVISVAIAISAYELWKPARRGPVAGAPRQMIAGPVPESNISAKKVQNVTSPSTSRIAANLATPKESPQASDSDVVAAPTQVAPSAEEPSGKTGTESATPAVNPETRVAPKEEAPKSVEAPRVATESPNAPAEDGAARTTGTSGSYDAGTNVIANPRTGDAKAEMHGQPEIAKSQPTAEELVAKRNAEEAQAAILAPDPNAPRERVVTMGAFVQPREVGPDPSTPAHKTTFQPGDIEGLDEGHRPECRKNITIAGLKGEKLVLGTPAWAARWIEKNQKRMPQVCFSDTPMTNALNYLVVFYTAPANAEASKPENSSATPQGVPAGGVGAFTLSYGSTWHYAKERNIGVTVVSHDELDQPQSEAGKIWYATAYTEEGLPVSENWPEKPKKPVKLDERDVKSKKARVALAEIEHVSDGLLRRMVEDIAKL